KSSLEIEDTEAADHAAIRAWIIDLVEQKPAATSINRKIATLRSFYKFLLQSGFISKDPTYKLKALKTPKKLPEFVQEDAMDKLLDEMIFDKIGRASCRERG